MSKRGQNEGTIYKRADGRWEGALTLPGTGGKRKRVYGKTQREVREQLTALRRDLDQGMPVVTERQTVGQFLDRWLVDVVKPHKSPKTAVSYAQVTRLYLAPTLGQHLLTKLEPRHVQAMMNGMVERGLAPRTVQYARAILRKALNQALKWGYVARNVATLVDPPKVKRHEITPLDASHAGRFLDAARDDRLRALFTVGVALGLRQGELLGLRWEDIDFATGTLTVRKQLQRIDGKPQLVDLKTERSRRTLPLPAVTASILRAHRARQVQDRLLAGSRWQDWGLVFASTIGTPLDPRNLTDRYKALLAQAGLPNIRFHDMRHSCASLLIAQGVPLEIVSRILGHSQISLTMNTYVHLLPQAQQQAADAMDRLFGGAAVSAG